jgi:protein-tyrosine phosphatase
MVLKADHFPAADRARFLDVQISGAPNFRRIHSVPLFAVGQPSVFGVRAILNIVGQTRHVKWICLREEPVIYINQRSFVLREIEHPFRNMKDFQGMDWKRIEEIEVRLKRDILREAEKNGGNILIHREVEYDQMSACWESIVPSSVKTSREVYDDLLKSEGYQITYSRIPITPQSTLHPKDIDHLIRMFLKSGDASSNYFVFNCQMGRGRSTFGTIILTLLFLYSNSSLTQAFRDQVSVKEDEKSAVEFPEVLKLLRILDNGQVARRDVDLAIEVCGSLFNLKNELNFEVKNLEAARDQESQKAGQARVTQSLDRYCFLICLAAYLREVEDLRNPKVTFDQFYSSQTAIEKFRNSLVKGELVRISSHLAMDQSASSVMPSISLTRKGSVLQSETILKDCFFKALNESEKLLVVSGAPNFTKVGGLPLACMAQPDFDGISSVISMMSVQESKQKICWISFQVEPVIYLKRFPFVVRDSLHPFRCLKEFNFALSPNRMYQISRRLKSDIISELLQSDESIVVVHKENDKMELLESQMELKESDIKTVDEVFQELSADYSVEYHHIPMATEDIPNTECFDMLFRVFEESAGNSAFIFNCQMGRGRSTFGMVACALFMKHKGILPLKDAVSSNEAAVKNEMRSGEFKAILSLIRVLKKGQIIKDEVDVAINICSHTHNIRESILDPLLAYETDRSGTAERESYLRLALVYLMRYAYLLCWNSYLYDIFLQKVPGVLNFSSWWRSRPELQTWFDKCVSNPEQMLKLATIPVSSDLVRVYDSREGNVLVKYSILKSDYFPGCQNKKLLPIIDGAPNFRIIKNFPVAGCAIPSGDGIKNAICEISRFLNDESPFVFWTNLREEPLLYVNGSPYCLRDADDPYSNLIYTGITTRRVEAMEKQLKEDALGDSSKYENKLLLHHEGDDTSLIGTWEIVNFENVKTCKEMYTSALDHKDVNADFFYTRVPITDEQAPLPETFDYIIQNMCMKSLDKILGNVFFVFNCQMGRGRTTTGIVICCLWIWRCRNLLKDKITPQLEISSSKSQTKDENISDTEDALLRGEYKLIMKLVRILNNGSEIKAEVDAMLDHCSEMQNLRTAIFNLKTRAEAIGQPKSQEEALHRGISYLIRYFYLICFNSYLSDAIDSNFDFSFVSWLKNRPEIEKLLEDVDLSF